MQQDEVYDLEDLKPVDQEMVEEDDYDDEEEETKDAIQQ